MLVGVVATMTETVRETLSAEMTTVPHFIQMLLTTLAALWIAAVHLLNDNIEI